MRTDRRAFLHGAVAAFGCLTFEACSQPSIPSSSKAAAELSFKIDNLHKLSSENLIKKQLGLDVIDVSFIVKFGDDPVSITISENRTEHPGRIYLVWRVSEPYEGQNPVELTYFKENNIWYYMDKVQIPDKDLDNIAQSMMHFVNQCSEATKIRYLQVY